MVCVLEQGCGPPGTEFNTPGLHHAVCSKLEAFGKSVIILNEKQYGKSNLYGLAGCACLSQVSQ